MDELGRQGAESLTGGDFPSEPSRFISWIRAYPAGAIPLATLRDRVEAVTAAIAPIVFMDVVELKRAIIKVKEQRLANLDALIWKLKDMIARADPTDPGATAGLTKELDGLYEKRYDLLKRIRAEKADLPPSTLAFPGGTIATDENGAIEVTDANKDTKLSTHFKLREFVCPPTMGPEVSSSQGSGSAAESLQVLPSAGRRTRALTMTMRRRSSPRWPLVACAAALLACTPLPRFVDSDPQGVDSRALFERLVETQVAVNLPNSHTKSAVQREADLCEGRRSIERLTAELASTRDLDEATLFKALSQADPDEFERAECAARVLAARGVSLSEIRALLPTAVARWADVLESAAMDGARLARR